MAYSFYLAVVCYREVPWSEIPRILLQTGITTSIVMLLIVTLAVFALDFVSAKSVYALFN